MKEDRTQEFLLIEQHKRNQKNRVKFGSALGDFYASGYAKHCLEQARKARKNIIVRLKLRYFYKINPDRYADLIEKYVPLYMEENRIDNQKIKMQWQTISLLESDASKEEKFIHYKQEEELDEQFKKLQKQIKEIVNELNKYDLSTSLIL